MIELEIIVEGPDGPRPRLPWLPPMPLWIGRDPSCHLVLDSELVSRKHACLEREGSRVRVTDRSANGTLVGGRSLRREACLLPPSGEFYVGPYRLRVEPCGESAAASTRALSRPSATSNESDQDPRRGSRPDVTDSVPPALRRSIQRKLLDHLDLAHVERSKLDPKTMRPSVVAALKEILSRLGSELPNDEIRSALVAELADEAVGLGPLERLLDDESVDEIMVVDRNAIYVERRGRIEETAARFTDDESLRAVIERIVTPLGRRIDESTPLCDARLPDGSRVNAIIPPLASRGPCITIRKFGKRTLDLGEFVGRGSLSPLMARFLEAAVRARKNLVIAGGTGSGKTTLLNLLSQAIPETERIVTIEDAAELRLRQRHVVSLEARPANLEGKGAYSIRDLVRNALRMRPDRIVVGECRGGEAIDMLQAMNTGHEGSMTTTHANSPAEAIARLETLCLMAGLDLPVRAIRQQIAGSVHLLVQQARFQDGSRRVTSIAEVAGLSDAGEVQLRELFGFERTGVDGNGRVNGVFRASGCLPSFAGELLAQGLDYLRGEP